jgi:hypothetical protein
MSLNMNFKSFLFLLSFLKVAVEGFNLSPTPRPSTSPFSTELFAATSGSVTSGGVSGLKRVVVTGYGITSCLGNTIDDVKDSLYNCKSGITFSEEYAELGIKSQVRGKPDLDDKDFKELIPKSSLRFMGNNAKYAYIAMQRAIEHGEWVGVGG